MQAFVLAGGQGTRLRPFTVTLPKPLVPVGSRPVLEIALLWLRRWGVSHVTLAVNHLAELIMAFFGDGKKLGLSIEYSLESEPLGTVGPLRQIASLEETFLVMNGDVLSDLQLDSFLEQHRASGCALTVATHRRAVTIDYGVLDSTNRRVTGFREKPSSQVEVSMGIYAMSPRVLDFVPPSGPFGFDQLVLAMLAANAPIGTFLHDGFWIDIGRPEDYERAVEMAPTLAKLIGVPE